MSEVATKKILIVSSLFESLIGLYDFSVAAVFLAFGAILLLPETADEATHLIDEMPTIFHVPFAPLVVGLIFTFVGIVACYVGRSGRRWVKGQGKLQRLWKASLINLILAATNIFIAGTNGLMLQEPIWMSVTNLVIATLVFWCAQIEVNRQDTKQES